MNFIEIIPLSILIVILIITTIYDIKFHRIPNWLTFPTMAAGIGYHTYMKGIQGLLFSIEGLFLGLALFIVFYLTAGMGAGDIKLMGAVGGLIGYKGVFMAFLGTALVGGIYALILLTLHGHLKETIKRYGAILKVSIFTRRFAYFPPEKKEKMPVMAYGVAIAFGTLLSILTDIIKDVI
jgi:prepilin peptidase CpaA